jgi:hypothetical protein
VKATVNVRYLPKFLMLGEEANGTFKKVDPVGK